MSSALLRFSADRAHQLRDIAAVRGVPVSALIDRLVLDSIIMGEIADATPGVTIVPGKGTVALTVDDMALVPMPADDARSIADELDARKRLSLVYLGTDFVEVGPIGGSAFEMKVTTPAGEVRRVFTPSVAADLARQLRSAADRSKLN